MIVSPEDPAYDWVGFSALLDGKPYGGINKCEYENEVTKAYQYGQGGKPRGITRGQLKPGTPTITMSLAGWKALSEDIGDSISTKKFDVIVQYAYPDAPTITDTLVGCRITKVKISAESGENPVEAELTLMPMDILLNGKSMLGPALSAAS